jgi:hypothetical protein
MMMLSDDIFIGPVLRRAQTDLVVVCLATFQPFALKFSVRVVGTEGWLGHDSVPFNVVALPNLHFYFARITPAKGKKFPTGTLLEYSIGVVDPATEEAEYSSFANIVRIDRLAYHDAELPSFYLQAANSRLNVLHGSCRKIHDASGGKADALSFGDDIVENYYSDPGSRPTVLCLGGDQIYADDVNGTVLEELGKLSGKIVGNKLETLPASLSPPPVGRRGDFVTKNAKFTSGKCANHLITLPEYLGMYGLMWNVNNWSELPAELSHFTSTLPKVRRLLANVPTYMIFDDHDVTDDWNLSVKWTVEVNASKLGKRIVANALAAYWLCQGYGNHPDRYEEDLSLRIADAIKDRDKDYDRYEGTFLTLDRWEFFTPTYPIIYFLDTRTQRGFKDGLLGHDTNAPAYLKSVTSWGTTLRALNGLLKNQNRSLPVVLVAAAPVFGFKLVEELQSFVDSDFVMGPYFLDLESWSANRKHMLLFLHLMGNANVVVLSGDVHYGFTSTVKFSVFDDKTLRNDIKRFPRGVTPPKAPSGTSPSYTFLWSSKFIQLTSSALKNFADDVAVKIPAAMTTIEPAVFVVEDGGTVEGKYENGEFFEWIVPLDDKPGRFVKKDKEILKPSSLFRQRINDAFNSPYVSEHNIGLLRIDAQEISNAFYTPSGKIGERTWNFANDKYWE